MSRAPDGPGLAVVVDAPGRHRLVVHERFPPGPGEALVRVYASGVCGSDREVYRGTRPEGFVRYPLTPGHEWSGTVAEVGEGVPEDLVGRKVVGEGFRSCLLCERCHTGDSTLCTAGYDETGFTRPGAMAPTLTLPARLLHTLLDDADLTAAALLEPAACVAAATLAAAPRPGERVAVVGAGTLGLIAVQLLAASSPAAVYVVEPRRERAELARELGATSAVRTAEGMEGRCDLVLETAGSPGSARTSVDLARRGGRVVLTGIPAPGATGLDPAELVTRRLTLHTVFGAPPAAWAHAVRAFGAGLLDLAALVTHELPLGAFPQAMELVGSGDPKVGKVLLRP
ncbi:zinc-binding dehydrogenase [Streptomyces sp. NPDC057271]|uniref:zinc-dependent alcohol dehydrogenase n=1 Tax=unclassified Streptomyces TaxID=2593676 RepID=UPI00363F1BF5